MATLNNVRVAGWIGPGDSTDTFYCTDPIYGIDGLRSVVDKPTRDAITTERRRQGMLVVVQQDFGLGPNTVWQLNPSPWTFTDSDWTQFSSGGVTTVVGGDLSGSLPDPLVVSTNGVPFGTLAIQNASAVVITGGTITGLPTPSQGSDAATKAYVDASTSGLSAKASSRLASTTNLTATYNNGAAGVGATLTNSGSLAAFSLDGVTANLNDRILIKNQTTTPQNGIYTLTTVGSGAVPWVLTRAVDFNTSTIVVEGAYTVIEEGTTDAGTLWLETGLGPFTLGTTPIIFTELTVATLTTTLTGDLSGTGSGTISVSVIKINGASLGSTTPASGNLLIGSGTSWVSEAITGDVTLLSTGATTVTKTNGVLFSPSATIDTTNATNISSGIIPTARLGTGTASTTTFLRGDNTWQTLPVTVTNPAGTDTQVQFNQTGSFGASANLAFNYTTNTLTATNLAGSGTAITNLNASNLASGTVNTARLGTGTANNTTFLRGDNTWAAVASAVWGKTTWSLAAGIPIAVGTDKTAWAIIDQNRTLTRVYVVAKTAPTGASLVLDILYSTNNGTSFTSLWAVNPGNRPTLTTGTNFSTITAFDTTTLAAGTLLRIDVIQVGSTTPGQDLTVQLQYQ
jgi:hypothetical protein